MKLPLLILLLFFSTINGCSVMGGAAKAGFTSVKKIYAVQPDSIRDNYPNWMKKTFFTSELLTTDYSEWKIRMFSEFDLENNITLTELEYILNFETYREMTDLRYEGKSEVLEEDVKYFVYDFSFSNTARAFWEQYQYHLYEMDKPWFTYQISPILPAEIKSKIEFIHYNYAPNWGFLSLREFMELFDLNTDKRWDDFCFWNNYGYDDSSVCGDIRIEDDLKLTQKTDS